MTPARALAPWWQRFAAWFSRRPIAVQHCPECGSMTIESFNRIQRDRAISGTVCISRVIVPPFAGGGRVCVKQHLTTWC